MKKLFTLLLICANLTQGYATSTALTGSKASKEYTDKLVVTINGESSPEQTTKIAVDTPKDGIMNMRNKKWENDFSPIEADGASYVDTMYSRAYLRHLFHAQELLALQIASIHNLAFYLWLVGEARKHIIAGDFSTWKPAMVKRISTRL